MSKIKRFPRPMLACSQNVTNADLQSLQYPLYGSFKSDGIRCRTVEYEGKTIPISRSNTLIPNAQINMWAEDDMFPHFDGELIIPDKSFHEIQSAIMTVNSVPIDFRFMVFDYLDYTLNFRRRYRTYIDLVGGQRFPRVEPVRQYYLKDKQEVLALEEGAIENGYEGLILRSIDGRYKHGRATWNEGLMYKKVLWERAEAVIIDFEEAEENTNAKEVSKLGLSKRSHAKAGMIPKGTLGALVCIDCKTRQQFNIGSGFSAAVAQDIWDNRPYYLGKAVTYKFKPYGVKNKPRTPIFVGVRLEKTKR